MIPFGTPVTQQETWDDAAATKLREIIDWGLGTDPNDLRGQLVRGFNSLPSDNDIELVLLGAGRAAWDEIADIETPESVVRLLARKHHDYGPDNIWSFGIRGVFLRMHDKACRLQNLERRMNASLPASEADAAMPVVPENESLTDTWLDIVGYAVVGLMVQDKTFLLPLAVDAKRATA